MGLLSTFSTTLLLCLIIATGMVELASYYDTYTGGYVPQYIYKTFYTTKPQQYKSYFINPYSNYRYTSRSYPKTYNDDVVYVTDMYGRTTATSNANLRARYSYGRCVNCNSNPLLSYQTSTCTSSTCGQNAHCSVIGGRPVCSCMRNYMGDPLSSCRRAECLDNSECRGHLSCRDGHCINPCEGVCGINANCEVRLHVPICTCPAGYTGNPFTLCRRFDPSELCHPSPCGSNTHCEVVNEVPTCKCLPGYHGSPLNGCRHECESDSECGPSSSCIEFKCQNPCSLCGQNAECEVVRNHIAACKCPKGYFGDPYVSCKPECIGDVDCPGSRPACFYGICKNPCDGVCGIGANCELRGLTPICSCPKDMTGDPFVMCRPFDKRDLCEPNPCGTNAKCEPGYDRTNKERPVCTCYPGYIGDPLTGCIQGECTADEHCPDSQGCTDYRCQNPCRGQCGVNAMCDARRHIAVCTCPAGYLGDALSQCYLERTATVGCTTCH